MKENEEESFRNGKNKNLHISEGLDLDKAYNDEVRF
jgi:hypothetical protein